MKKLLALVLAALMLLAVLASCAEKQVEQSQAPQTEEAQTEQPEQAEEPAVEETPVEEPEELPAEEPAAEPALEDGVYTAEFNTDSSMFHANEACDGKGTLTVQDGKMTIHVSLVSKTILNLYPGLAEDAQKDHKVSVSNPEPLKDEGKTVEELGLADGTYTVEVGFAGGSGKAYVQTPCTLSIADGKATATIVWSSSKYDYMLVDDVKYDVLSTENGSTFEIPVAAFDTDLAVIGDTTAMSTPHEIEYTLNFDSASLTAAE